MPEPDDRPRVSATRIGIWVIVGAIGLYMVVNGVVTALTSGG